MHVKLHTDIYRCYLQYSSCSRHNVLITIELRGRNSNYFSMWKRTCHSISRSAKRSAFLPRYSIESELWVSMRSNDAWLACNTDLGPARVEITGDVPEIGTHARPRLPLVDNQAEMAPTGGTVAVAHLDRACLHDGTLRGEASSRPWPWARQRCTVAVNVVTLRKLKGRVSHRAVRDRNCHLGRRRWQLIHGRLHQVRQWQARQVLDVAGLQPDHQRLLGSGTAGSTRRPIYRTKKKNLLSRLGTTSFLYSLSIRKESWKKLLPRRRREVRKKWLDRSVWHN